MHLSSDHLNLKSLNSKTKEELVQFILSDSDFEYLIKDDFLPALQNLTSDSAFPCQYWSVEKEDKVVGLVVLKHISDQHRTTELLITFKGVECRDGACLQDLIKLVLGYAFLDLNLNRIEVKVLESDSRMIKAYKSFGFQEEGLLRSKYFIDEKHQDVYVMSLLQVEWERLMNQ